MRLSEIRKELDGEFWESLKVLDETEAFRVKEEGCLLCGGKLHRADYRRKPRGGICKEGKHVRRHSFCCAECRKRKTPESVRFLGRKVYVGVIVFLGSYFREGRERVAVKKLTGMFGVSEVTVRRWLKWWHELVPASSFWKSAEGFFMPPIEKREFLVSLFERFRSESLQSALCAVLTFLSPLTVPTDYPA